MRTWILVDSASVSEQQAWPLPPWNPVCHFLRHTHCYSECWSVQERSLTSGNPLPSPRRTHTGPQFSNLSRGPCECSPEEPLYEVWSYRTVWNHRDVAIVLIHAQQRWPYLAGFSGGQRWFPLKPGWAEWGNSRLKVFLEDEPWTKGFLVLMKRERRQHR